MGYFLSNGSQLADIQTMAVFFRSKLIL